MAADTITISMDMSVLQLMADAIKQAVDDGLIVGQNIDIGDVDVKQREDGTFEAMPSFKLLSWFLSNV